MTPVSGAEDAFAENSPVESLDAAPAVAGPAPEGLADPDLIAAQFEDDGPANAARGEAVLEIEGTPCRLCLTLGALAELERAFRVTGLKALAKRLARASAQDVLVVLSVLARAGGAAVTAAELARAKLNPVRAALAIAAVFARAHAGAERPAAPDARS